MVGHSIGHSAWWIARAANIVFLPINRYWFSPFIWNKFTLDVIIIVAHWCDYFNFKASPAAPNKTISIFSLAAVFFKSHSKIPPKSRSSIECRAQNWIPNFYHYYWIVFFLSPFVTWRFSSLINAPNVHIVWVILFSGPLRYHLRFSVVKSSVRLYNSPLKRCEWWKYWKPSFCPSWNDAAKKQCQTGNRIPTESLVSQTKKRVRANNRSTNQGN